MELPLCSSCGQFMEAILQEVLGVLFRCPNCAMEVSRPFTGPGDKSFATDSPLEG